MRFLEGRKILGMNNKTQLNFQMNNTSENQVPNSIERARLANLFTQGKSLILFLFLPIKSILDMYSIWPYPPYFSPVGPTPGFSMMPTQYMVPLPTQYPTNGIPSSSQTTQPQHVRNSACGEPMLIQIGVQCVNQNNPVNINSLNDICAPVLKTTTNITSNIDPQSDLNGKTEDNNGTTSMNSTSFIEKCNNIESLIKETEKKLG